MPDLQCRVLLRVSDATSGPWQLPTDDEVWAGRGANCGLYIGHPWMPLNLARFLPAPQGWLVENGSRARLRVRSTFVGDAHFAPRALVALQPGQARISWPDLDEPCQMDVEIGDGVANGLEVVRNGQFPPDVDARTRYAVHALPLTPGQRKTMAVLFAHLILGGRKPSNLALAAADQLGRSEQAVKNQANDLRRRLNKERWLKMKDTDQLGYYLVVTTRTITAADLPEGYPGNPS